jgi:flagellar hook-associated protein 2
MSTSSSSNVGTATTSATPLFNVGGLATGLDTNTIITQLLAIDRQPETLIQNNQAIETARQQALQAIQTQLKSLQTAGAALRDPTVWGDTQSVTSNNTAAVTAVRTGGAAAGGFQIGISQLAQADQMTQQSSLTAASAADVLHVQVGTGTALNVSIAAGDTISTIASKINGSSNSQVYASVVNNQLVLSGKVTGAANTIAVTSDGSLASDLGMSETLTAKDAKFTLNGTDYTRASNIVSDAMAGVTLTLNGTTSSDATLVVSTPAPNSTNITNALQSFVTTYNQTVDLISGYVNQAKVANPQSAADRQAGMLQGDPQLLSILSKLRQSMSQIQSSNPSDMDYLGDVGLSTGKAVGTGTISQDSLEGKLSLDTDQLTSALASNFSAVKALFTNATGTTSTEGLTQRLDDIINPVANATGSLASRITSEQSLISSYTSQIAAIEQRVTLHETALRAQFTAMETAVSQMQSTSSSLSGQISSLGTG